MSRFALYTYRLVVLAAVLAAWQYLPKIGWLSQHIHFMDPFFISSPDRVAHKMWAFMFPPEGAQSIWPYLGTTIESSLIGFAIGTALGFALGLALSNMPRVNAVVEIYIVALNSIPRVALVPIIILIAGPGMASAVLSAVIIVFFITFFSAYEGGTHVPPAVLENAKVMKASPWRVMMRIRLSYVALWTFAIIPNSLAFSLVAVVTNQILSGSGGVGVLLLTATTNLDSTVTVAVVIFLSVAGVAMLKAAMLLRRRILFWADEQY